MCSFRLAGAVGGGGVPRKGGPPPVTDGLTRERRRDGPERRLDAPRMYCVAVINPMSCPRGLVALTYPLVNALCPRPHFSRKRCSFRIANALNVSSTDWQNVHRVIARPVVAAAAPGAAPGASGECAAEPTVGRFFASSTTRAFSHGANSHSLSITPTSFWAFLAKPTRGVGSRYCLLKVRSKLCLSAFESQTFRVHRDGRSALRVFGENKPPFWSQTAPRGAAGQTVLPRGSCVLFRSFRRLARALLRAHKHPTSSTVVATRVVVFHSLGSSTFYTATCPSPCPPPSRSTASPPSTPWAR